MAAETGTSTTQRILEDWAERYDPYLAELEQRMLGLAARLAGEVRIEPYNPYLTGPSGWLPVVEARIHRSVLPEESEGGPSTEWLSEDAANAAISFFRNGADLLPTEPHIYGTKSGDLVAEFETEVGSMTSVVSDNQTVLFAVLRSDPHEPIQSIIRRGSNQFRDELRSFTRKLVSGSDGKLESTE